MTDKDRLDFLEGCPKAARYIPTVAMNGKYPCWCVDGVQGRKKRKTLRDAIDAAMGDVALPVPRLTEATHL